MHHVKYVIYSILYTAKISHLLKVSVGQKLAWNYNPEGQLRLIDNWEYHAGIYIFLQFFRKWILTFLLIFLMTMKKLTEDRIDSESQIGSKVYTDCPTMQFFSCQAMLQAPYRMSTSIVAFPWGFATNDNNIVTFQWHIHAIHMLYPINSRPQLSPEHYLSLSFFRSKRSSWSD